MKRTSKLVILITLFSLLLAACAPAATPAPAEVSTVAPTYASIVLTDGLQREVTLVAPAQRIVSLAPSNTEILYAIGAGDQVVGCDEFSNYPDVAADLPSVGGSMGNYDLEAIAALNPDLVLAAEINTPEQVQALEGLGLNIYYLSNPTDLEGMYANLLIVGQLSGHEADAQALVDSLRERVDIVTTMLADVTEKPVVFYELDGSDAAKPWTAGSGTFLSTLVEMAGGVNAADDLQGAYAQISLEDLLVKDPDIILLGDANYGMTPDQVAQRAGWDALTAVQNGNMYEIDDDLISRPGPRQVEGLERFAKLFHPELFK